MGCLFLVSNGGVHRIRPSVTFDVSSNSPFVSQVNKYKAIWKEIQAIYQKSLGAFFQAPLPMCLLLTRLIC